MIQDNTHINSPLYTDKAWNSLYSRLEREDLIPARPVQRLFYPAYAGIAAVFAILCVCGALGIWYMNSQKNASLLTLQNGAEDSALVTTLNDGSIVYLSQNATLRYPEHFEADRRSVKLEGNALFDVSENKRQPFLIETQYTTIEVLGTAFNVKCIGENNFELSVQRGLVKVTLRKGGESLYVKAGETVSLLDHKFQKYPTKDMDQFADYTERIHFKDESLANIVRVINRMNQQPVTLASSDLKSRRLTVSFHENTTKSMTELICLALGLRCVEKSDTLIIANP